MRRYLGTAAVLMLAGFGLWGSYWATTAYLGAHAALDGIRLSCHVLQTAEARNFITRDQRKIIIKSLVSKSGNGSGNVELDTYLETDCSKTFFEDVWGKLST